MLGAASAIVACVDVTPITDVPVDPDAGVDAGVSPVVEPTACLACSTGAKETGPSCSAEYAKCAADPKCLSLFSCGLPRGCYTGQKNLLDCLTTCGIAAGLTGADDPAVAPFMALYLCATTSCSAECVSTP